MNVLVLGAAGMLGHTLFRVLMSDPLISVTGTVRSLASMDWLPEAVRSSVVPGVDADDFGTVDAVVERTRPSVVINCIGIVKQRRTAENPLIAIGTNALFPHRLAQLCRSAGARVIQISTDCVFSGSKGMYTETDTTDAADLYGRTKQLGELGPPDVTLRTSIIGHELGCAQGLVEWFLAQNDSVKGFRHAIFSGLPAVELADVIRTAVLGNSTLSGLYHVAATPISKYDLLTLLAKEYNHTVRIIPDDSIRIDRSLDGRRFHSATGYLAPGWPDLVRRMHQFQMGTHV